MDFLKYNIKEKKKKKKATRIIKTTIAKNIYMVFALKIGSFSFFLK